MRGFYTISNRSTARRNLTNGTAEARKTVSKMTPSAMVEMDAMPTDTQQRWIILSMQYLDMDDALRYIVRMLCGYL